MPVSCTPACRPWGRTKDDLLAAQVGEADRVAGVGLELEVGGGLAYSITLGAYRTLSVRFSISMSLVGFLAGPRRASRTRSARAACSFRVGVRLEAWRKPHGLEGGEVNASTPVVERSLENVGAYVMGRNMFGGGGALAKPVWNGWWGDDPPFHAPVSCSRTTRASPCRSKTGRRSSSTRTDRGGAPAGGGCRREGRRPRRRRPSRAECLAAGRVDEIGVSVAPVLLGGGTRLWTAFRDAARARRGGRCPGRRAPAVPGEALGPRLH